MTKMIDNEKSGKMRRGVVISVFFLSFLVTAFSFPPPASAMLFCLISAKTAQKECIFDDAQLCEKEADARGGRCTVNPDEVLVSTGSEPVCIVYSPTSAECIYQDFDDCRRDAKRNNAACVNLSKRQIFEKTQSGVIDTQKNESK